MEQSRQAGAGLVAGPNDPAAAQSAPSTPVTILDRLRAAGINEDRARAWIREGSVRVAGEPVTNTETFAPWPTRFTLNSA